MKTIDKNSNFKFVILYISEKYLIIFEISSMHNKKINTPPQTLIMFENSTLKDLMHDDAKIQIIAINTIFNIIFKPKLNIFAIFNINQTTAL